MADAVVYVQWNYALEARLVGAIPEAAFARASLFACKTAAAAIHGHGRGDLARDVGRPKIFGPLHAGIGSSLVYAAIENFGGMIHARSARRLLIHGGPHGGSGRFISKDAQGGDIVASAESVPHYAKHYLEAGEAAFASIFPRLLAEAYPG